MPQMRIDQQIQENPVNNSESILKAITKEGKSSKDQDVSGAAIKYTQDDVEHFISSLLYPDSPFYKVYYLLNGSVSITFRELNAIQKEAIISKTYKEFLSKYPQANQKYDFIEKYLEREILLWEMAQSLTEISVKNSLAYVKKETSESELISPQWLISAVIKSENRLEVLLRKYSEFKELQNTLRHDILEKDDFFMLEQVH
jgi:hypothetical protein